MDCPSGFWCLQLKDIINTLVLVATVFAIVYGPIRAVQITRQNDQERQKRGRQYGVFHSLMKTRRMWLMPEHVMALNLVQIEFYGQKDIIEAFKRYIEHLSTPVPALSQQKPFFEEREDRFHNLVHEMGKSLGFHLDRRELDKFGYSPQGWETEQAEIITFRRSVIELLDGRRGLPVVPFTGDKANQKYPPPPAE